MTLSRPHDAEQLKEAFANLGLDHEQCWLNSVTFSIPTIILQAHRHMHDAEYKATSSEIVEGSELLFIC